MGKSYWRRRSPNRWSLKNWVKPLNTTLIKIGDVAVAAVADPLKEKAREAGTLKGTGPVAETANPVLTKVIVQVVEGQEGSNFIAPAFN